VLLVLLAAVHAHGTRVPHRVQYNITQ
jgi:hypothetical protein